MPEKPIRTISEQDKGRYVIKKEEYDWSDFGLEDKPYFMEMAYTKDGKYIGTPEEAHYLCEELDIIPETISPDHNVCSIGYIPSKKSWAGWSHRALYDFKVGDSHKPGDCGHQYWGVDGDIKIENLDMAKQAAINFARSVAKVDKKTVEASYKFIIHSDDKEVEIRLTDGRIPMEMLKDPKKAQKHWDKKQGKSPKNPDPLKKVK